MTRRKEKHRTNKSLLQRFSLFFFDHQRITLVSWVAIVCFGFLSYSVLLQREGFPNVNLPFSTVSGAYFVGDKNKVDQDISLPISRAVFKLPQVKTINTTTGDNFVAMQIEYKQGTNPKTASNKVKNVVEKLGLPRDAQLKYQAIDFNKFDNKYDLLVSVHAPIGTKDTDLHAQAIKVAKNIENAGLVSKTVIVPQAQTAINPLTGKPTTQQTHYDRTAVAKNGKLTFNKSITVGVIAKSNADVLRLYDGVSEQLKKTDGKIETTISGSIAESVREQISSLQNNLLEGLIIVAIISLLLISWRAGVATSISMATVLLATIGSLKLIGYSLNTITLFALILSLALIVDDTTIVAEAIDAGTRQGLSKRQTVAHAIKRVARASTTGTLVTMLAFAPMIFIGGILGGFIRALPITIIISLAFSLLISLSLIPFMARWLIIPNKKIRKRNYNPVGLIEKAISNRLSRTILWTRGHNKRRIAMAITAIAVSTVALIGSIYFFGKLKFDIFPPSKDGDQMTVTLRFAPGTPIDAAEAITDKANAIMATELNGSTRRVVYQSLPDGNNAIAKIVLIPYKDRQITSPQIKDKLTTAFSNFDNAVVKVTLDSAGGPVSDQPFKVQINTTDPAKATAISKELAAWMSTAEIKRPNGTIAHFVNPQIATQTTITRKDGVRIFEVSSAFDGDDVSALVNLAKSATLTQFDSTKVESFGLKANALQFDFGNESNNQDSFTSMLYALPILLLVMLILLIIQFRSLLQPLLILLAIPFSFLGVAIGLYITHNPLSFFVMVGFFALIGIAVNNTIMLVDYANQALKSGRSYTQSIASAIRHRFRPLLTTSLISIVALTPLAYNDPFWQSLAVTLIFGLMSSTLLVILVFPYFWLIAEWLRLKVRNLWRRFHRKS